MRHFALIDGVRLKSIKMDNRLFFILAVTLLARVLLTPLMVDSGMVNNVGEKPYQYCELKGTRPHDFYAYICSGQRLLDGKSIYRNYSIHQDEYRGLPYPPLFPAVMALQLYYFGRNYSMLKMGSILADMLVCVFTYLIAKSIHGKEKALAALALYAFSYLGLINSGLMGNDDQFFLAAAMSAIYLYMRGRQTLSASCMGLALTFKLSSALFLAPLIIHTLKTRGLRKATEYGIIAIISALIILLPFTANDGLYITYPYRIGDSMPIDGLSLPNLLRLTYGLSFHALNPGMLLRDGNPRDPMNYAGIHPFNRLMKAIELPMMVLGALIGIWFIKRQNSINLEKDLVSGVAFFGLAVMILSKSLYPAYIGWYIPLIIVFFAGNNNWEKIFVGSLVTFASVALLGWGFGPGYEIGTKQQIALLLSIASAAAGAIYLFKPLKDIVKELVILIGLFATFEALNAYPFLIIYPYVSHFIGIEQFRQFGYYGIYYVIVILCVSVLGTLISKIAKKSLSDCGI